MDSDSEDSRPLALRQKKDATETGGAGVSNQPSRQPNDPDSGSASSSGDGSDSDDDMPLAARAKKLTPKRKASSDAKRSEKRQKRSASAPSRSTGRANGPKSGSGEPKWQTLEHHGVLFPPEYEPHRIKMLYDGQPVDLTPEQVGGRSDRLAGILVQ